MTSRATGPSTSKGRLKSGQHIFGCEIQIRTALQDAWAFISRADLYRRKDLAELLPKVAQIQARALAAADDALELIREEARQPVLPETEAQAEPTTQPQTAIAEPIPDSSEDDAFILRSPVSERRKEAFITSLVENRAKTATLENLFQQQASLAITPARDNSQTSGYNVLLRKGPFVEGSNWADYRTWEFALGFERHLLSRFERLLAPHATPSGTTGLEPEAVKLAVRQLATSLAHEGFTASLIVITGPLSVDFIVTLADPTLPREPHTPWIIGTYDQMPILNIREIETFAVYVVDLKRFATLAKSIPPMRITLEQVSEDIARDLIDRDPNAVTIPEGRPDSLDERIRQAMLTVWLRADESYILQLNDGAAAKMMRLANPAGRSS